jgi:hypothetical protein
MNITMTLFWQRKAPVIKKHESTQELEEELESERQTRAKADRSKGDLQSELEDLSAKLEEAGGVTAMHLEVKYNFGLDIQIKIS